MAQIAGNKILAFYIFVFQKHRNERYKATICRQLFASQGVGYHLMIFFFLIASK